MSNIRRASRVAAVACLVSMVCASGAAQSEQISGAEAGWAAITKCAAILDDDARHACSDEVLRNAGLLTTEAKSSAQRKGFGLQRPAVSTAPAASASDAATSKPTEKPHDDRLEVTLARVEQGRDGRLVLTTTEGAVWRQVESDAVRPMPVEGQTMKIAKTAFGGFMCEPGKHVVFRCVRAH